VIWEFTVCIALLTSYKSRKENRLFPLKNLGSFKLNHCSECMKDVPGSEG